MSTALYRLGRFAAVRPWVVIGAWLVVAISVVAASGTFGRDLEDSFEVPGLDSQEAIDLLADAGSDRAGLTAQVVVTPSIDGLTFDDSTIAAELAGLRSDLERLPNVRATDESIAPSRSVAIVRVQYPVLEDEPAMQPEIIRVDDLRLHAIEIRLDSELRIGRHEDAVVDLATLCVEHA
jgi:RND superfamily putative drug exporter